jgi:hypothetical protein
VQRAPGFPCALLFEGGSHNNPGATRRENADLCLSLPGRWFTSPRWGEDLHSKSGEGLGSDERP